MTQRSQRSVFTVGVLATVLALSPTLAYLQEQLPTGQYVTPTVLQSAIQQHLNPGVAGYPTSSPARPCALSSARTARRWRS